MEKCKIKTKINKQTAKHAHCSDGDGCPSSRHAAESQCGDGGGGGHDGYCAAFRPFACLLRVQLFRVS
jgi:hypothetical protein